MNCQGLLIDNKLFLDHLFSCLFNSAILNFALLDLLFSDNSLDDAISGFLLIKSKGENLFPKKSFLWKRLKMAKLHKIFH